jgi:hypothetical protein
MVITSLLVLISLWKECTSKGKRREIVWGGCSSFRDRETEHGWSIRGTTLWPHRDAPSSSSVPFISCLMSTIRAMFARTRLWLELQVPLTVSHLTNTGCVCVCVCVCERERERERDMQLQFVCRRSSFTPPSTAAQQLAKYICAWIITYSNLLFKEHVKEHQWKSHTWINLQLHDMSISSEGVWLRITTSWSR